VRAFIVVLAVAVGGCSASEIIQNWSGGPASDLSQPDYRRIVADNVKTIFPNQAPIGELQISDARLVDHLKGPAWLTCLRLDTKGLARHYAIFIKDNKVIDSRIGVVIDQCHKMTYTPLEIFAAADRPRL
jgi:hypothetical protein